MNEIFVFSEKRFSRAILGLNKAEVYAYLNQISSAYEELQLQIQVLKEQNNTLADSNRENALKLYNLQNDITEAQKKTDRANAECEAAKKECSELRRELQAAERRIGQLTDALIKAGDGSADILPEAEPEVKPAEDNKGFTPKPVFEEDKKSGASGTGGIKDIFAELRQKASSAKETVDSVKKEASTVQTATEASADGTLNADGEEVYAGEVEVKVDESMLIGNDDDDDEGFTFL